MSHTQTSLLPFFSVLAFSGEDRASFLHTQLSNHIEDLAVGHACYATYNTPKGRVIANMLVLNTGDELWVMVAKDLAEALAKRLRMFVMRAKVSIALNDDLVAAGVTTGAEPQQAGDTPLHQFAASHSDHVWHVALPNQSELLLGQAEHVNASHDATAEQAWWQTQILSGYPWVSQATTETCVAQMLNQTVLGGVHFKKGCYPGQEIIARAHYRGQVKRGLMTFTAKQAIAAGMPVLQDGADAGIVINASPNANGYVALAVIKHGAANVALTVNDGPIVAQQYFFSTETDAKAEQA
ncbi:MAG: folate-binding protein YgfZ [Neisseriaceae bacterium]|nr:folate-binding protein YgfZ [Neisseriaceae bacterium]MBP6863158.1 folate-binding protein YgfZ [Neisseriaceae bacterium]